MVKATYVRDVAPGELIRICDAQAGPWMSSHC
jgi:hypothetical protein